MIKDIFWKKYSLNLILGLIDIGLIVFIIFFPVKEIMKNINELVVLKKTIFSLNEQENNFDDLNKSYQANFETIKKVENVFIDSQEPVDFLIFIEDLSKELTLSTKIIPIASQKLKSDIWPSMTFNLSSNGKSEKLLAFLEKLENSKYLMEIIDVDIRKEKENNDQVEAEFILRVYVR